jgi:hypothetical protein
LSRFNRNGSSNNLRWHILLPYAYVYQDIWITSFFHKKEKEDMFSFACFFLCGSFLKCN